MLGEGTLFLGDDRRIVTMNRPFREMLKQHGWTDGKIYWVYNPDKDTIRLVKPDKLAVVIKNADGEKRTCKGTVYKHNYTHHPTNGGGKCEIPGFPS